jgi:predicted amidophosphoribosyltransferase
VLSQVHVQGGYWVEGVARLSSLGSLMRAAKERQDAEALATLQYRLVEFVDGLELPDDPLVLAVPPAPDRDAHPVPALARAVAAHLGVAMAEALARERVTPRLRDTPIEERRRVVEQAGYAVTGDVAGRAVVLVDDVILTGTTLRFLAGILIAAGARSVDAVVVCRTRLAAD